MDVASAYALISRAIDADRVAGGYLVCGDVKGGCMELADMVLARLFPDGKAQVAARIHPDVVYLEPEGRSRTIHAGSMRERLVEPMSSTAFSGGWKAGVVVGADRMEDAAANAFLKSLEEPTPRTLYLLLTDRPDMILPTIASRTQRIDLPRPSGLLEGEFRLQVAQAMESVAGDSVRGRMAAGRRLAEILGEAKDSAEDADVPLVRKAFYTTVMSHVRRWMIEGRLPRHLAFRNVEAVEEAFRRSERHIGDEPVLCSMADAISWP